MELRYFIPAFLLGAMLTGCCGFVFGYHYYGISVASYQGKLLGPTPADDLDFSKCENNGCIAMLSPEFYRFKQDHIDCENNLSDTQKQLTACLNK